MTRLFALVGALLSLVRFANAEIIAGQAVSWTDFSHVTCIAASSNFIYYGTTQGILLYQRNENRWYDPITVSDGLPDPYINRITVTFDDARLSVETNNGIYTYDSQIERWFPEIDFPTFDYRSSTPRPPLPDILMPFGYQFYREGYVTDQYLRDFRVSALLQDDYYEIYFGLWGLGPAKADNENITAELLPGGLIQKRCDAIYIDGDSLWLGGNVGERSIETSPRRAGATLLDRSKGRFTQLEPRYISGFDSEIIYDICGDDKNIYFAGRFGMTVLSRDDDHFFTISGRDGLPSDDATAVTARNDSVWIGSSRGLAIYTPSVDTLNVVAANILGDRFVTSLYLYENKLIIGTRDGCYFIDLESRVVGRLRDDDGILDSEIRHITSFGSDLFISSAWGLSKIDMTTEKARPVPYTEIPNGIYACAANEQYVLAAAEDELILINRKNSKKRSFYERDGLISTHINIIVPEGDYVWLGSEEGLTRFKWVNPERVD